ncbi:hypothetical protein N780_05490 [Pontibacillus chungwhensis BH030062]|uniref:Uncharacterized protein n=1 Tax=Pontibacillus chungwhensis BH030062 TaxID=1385513 RepID=A0A0A2V9N3_9BACI|nr:hypothetical protein N780_05490 [Pontibacillus chungwhensis BH030062]
MQGQAWGLLAFLRGAGGASSFAFALCGVSPRLLTPRESRSPQACPNVKQVNDPPIIFALNPHTYQLWHVSVSPYLAKVGLEITRLLREKEVDETPQGGFPEEARQLARGKRVVSRPTLRSTKADGNITPFIA